jgi:hypothetical protein
MRKPDKTRFEELLLYISSKCSTDPHFGATKLNKILFYADFLAYAMLGDSITGFKYQKLQHGPVPRGVKDVKEKLIDSGTLKVDAVLVFGEKEQHRPVGLREANVSIFGLEELKLVDQIIDSVREKTAIGISELSHIEVGWKVARQGETIPYGTIFLSDKPLTNEETTRIQRFATEHGYAAG